MNNQRRIADVEGLADFQRYYTHGYIGWPDDEGNYIPAQVYRVDAAGAALRKLHRKVKGTFEFGDLFNASWEQLVEKASFGRPLLGNIQFKNNLLFMSIRGERHMARGLHPGRVFTKMFNQWDVKDGNEIDTNNFEIISEIYNPTRHSVLEAFELLSSGKKIGVPITGSVGLVNSSNCKYPMVTYKKWPVGYMERSGHVKVLDDFVDYYPILKKTGMEVSAHGRD